MGMPLPNLKPVPLRDRLAMVFVEKGQIDVLDGAFVVVDVNGVRTHIPVGGVACLMLEPGTRISHAAVTLAARAGTVLIWVGEAAVRVYSSGRHSSGRADRLLYQARLALEEKSRLAVVRKMYALRFGEEPPARRSIEQLRGIEGVRVRDLYKRLGQRYGIEWKARNYDQENWDKADLPNRCLSVATSCLYGLAEAAILAAGYSPAIGFIHTGKPLSFAYDIADLFKFETAVPVAFQVAAAKPEFADREVRLRCRDVFRARKLLQRIIPTIEEVLAAGGVAPPVEGIEEEPRSPPSAEEGPEGRVVA